MTGSGSSASVSVQSGSLLSEVLGLDFLGQLADVFVHGEARFERAEAALVRIVFRRVHEHEHEQEHEAMHRGR
ncbi:MAG: hypothetical protein R3F05_16320 [Planctomycetota bacterium]